MTRPSPRSDDAERARQEAAIRRLEELLREPGPGITVTPIGEAEEDWQTLTARQSAEGAQRGSLADRPVETPPREEVQHARPARIRQPGSAPEARAGANDRAAPSPVPASPEPVRPNTQTTARPKAPLIPPSTEAASARVRASGHGELWDAIQMSRRAFTATGIFSLVINLLMLTGPIFMLQVYDRVMTSGSMPTLVALTLLTVLLYAIVGALELVRSRVIVRIGREVEEKLADRVFTAGLCHSIKSKSQSSSALRELDNLRQFIGGQGPLAFFDAPWTPIYLLVIFLVHWMLGIAAAIGTIILLGLSWMSETRSRSSIEHAGKTAAHSVEIAETGQRNAEALMAMGMASAYRQRWQTANAEAISWQMQAADKLGGMSAVSKALRLLMQSLMLAIGAALALMGEISAGSIIAATIIFGRALAPVEQAIGHWRGFLKARDSYARLDELLASEPPTPRKVALPPPQSRLHVEGLRVASPDTRNLILAGVNFNVEPGQMLAVIGPSASGKSTLARALVNLWPPVSGAIKLDGARLDQWEPESLGRHLGYLPQNVGLFAGTVRDNICRFTPDASDEEVVMAAQQAHAHDLILQLPQGYDTELGAFGAYLSAGQRQRIALARALFRDPALIVLDEPNSNLDRAGDEALSSTIDGLRARGKAIVLISHRVQAIGKADLLLYLERGTQRAFGPRAEVMRLFQPSPQPRSEGQGAVQNPRPPADNPPYPAAPSMGQASPQAATQGPHGGQHP